MEAKGQIFIRHVPELKARLAADALEQGSNMQDVANRILAKRYKVKLNKTAGRKAPTGTNDKLVLRPPMELHRAVAVAAAAKTGDPRFPEWSIPREAAHTLCVHYGLRLPPLPGRSGTSKRPRQRRRPVAATT